MLMLSENKSPIQLFKSLHILAVLKPFYCKKSFYCCTNWQSIQSTLGMVAAESKLQTSYKIVEKSVETVKYMLMKLSNAFR